MSRKHRARKTKKGKAEVAGARIDERRSRDKLEGNLGNLEKSCSKGELEPDVDTLVSGRWYTNGGMVAK